MTDLMPKGGVREPDLELFVKVRGRGEMEELKMIGGEKVFTHLGNVILFSHLRNAIVALELQQ